MKKNSDGRKLFPNVRNAESIPVILTIALAIVLGGILAAFCAVRSNVKSSQTEIAGASAVETAEETETVELASVSEEEYVATVRVTINPEFLLYINVNNEVVKCEAVNADAEDMMDGIDILGKPVTDCIERIVSKAIDKGYLPEGGTVTVETNAALGSKSDNVSYERIDKKYQSALRKIEDLVNKGIRKVCEDNSITISVVKVDAETKETVREEVDGKSPADTEEAADTGNAEPSDNRVAGAAGNTSGTSNTGIAGAAISTPVVNIPTVASQVKPATDNNTTDTSFAGENSSSSNNSGSSGNSGNTSNSGSSGNEGGSGSTSTDVPIPEVPAGYTLKWADEFNGNELNRDDWNVELHNPGWVNNELQAYVDSEENITVKDGKLIITPIKTVADDGSVSYTSGRVNTQNKKNFKYGYFEARVKVPEGQGYLPAFWLMAADENLYGQWPRCGEIDCMEVMGQNPNKVYGTIHYGHNASNGHKESQGTHISTNGSYADGFHTFSCEWNPGKITWYVDGIKYHEENNWYTAQSDGNGVLTYPAPFDQQFYIILNLAVGGSWVGNPNDSTSFDTAYEIDYVRVYQKASYDENVQRPEQEEVVMRDPDANGNYLLNGNFAENLNNWTFKSTTTGGEGSASVIDTDGGKMVEIKTTNAGPNDYSIQLVQEKVPLKAGSTYELSFDTYASENRLMKVNSKAPDNGWAAYLNETIDITTQKQTVTRTFAMKEKDDPNCTIEFNLGATSSTATVYIGNVVLKETTSSDEDRDNIMNPAKGPRADGNYIYNGSFSEGDSYLGDWSVSGQATVTSLEDGRRLKVENNGASITQTNVPVKNNVAYSLSMKTVVPEGCQIEVCFDGQTMTVPAGTDGVWSQQITTCSSDSKRDIEIKFVGDGVFYIDDVCLIEDALIKNGSFDMGLAGYELFVDNSASASGSVDAISNANAAAIDIKDTGDSDWKIQLKQNDVKLEKDKWYRLSLDAKSTIERKIMFAIQRDGSADNDWTPYSGQPVVDVNGEWQSFDVEFQMKRDTDLKSILSISMGAVGGTSITTNHTVNIDNISLVEIEPPKQEEVEVGSNMLKPLIADNELGNGWEVSCWANGECTTAVNNESVVVKISSVGKQDSSVALKYSDLIMEKGASYKLTFKAMSTEDRDIKPCFMDPVNEYSWYGGVEKTLKKGETADITLELNNVDKPTSSTILFQVGLGKIYENNPETPVSDITLSDFCLVKTSGGSEQGSTDPETPEDDTTVALPEMKYNGSVEGNLIRNNSFQPGTDWTSTIANWGNPYVTDASGSIENGIYTYVIINPGTEDWHVQLKQSGISLEKGKKYKCSYDIASTVGRSINSGIMSESNKWYGGSVPEFEAGKLTHIEFEFTMEEADSNANFYISMGKVGDSTPASTISIANIVLVEVPSDSSATAQNDAPAESTLSSAEQSGVHIMLFSASKEDVADSQDAALVTGTDETHESKNQEDDSSDENDNNINKTGDVTSESNEETDTADTTESEE